MGAMPEESPLAVQMIREVRREAGAQRVSDAELSRRSGIPYATLRRLVTEDPRRGPITIRQVEALAKALGVDPVNLMGRAVRASRLLSESESDEVDDVVQKMTRPPRSRGDEAAG